MFDLFTKKQTVNPPSPLRETFFGDFSMEMLCAQGSGEGHIAHFMAAKNALDSGDQQSAAEHLKKVTEMPGLESRTYLAAWFHLQNLGIEPAPPVGQKVLGVVLEIWMEQGLDVLAAYDDGSARYINYTGAAVIWDVPGADAEIERRLRHLLAVGQEVAPKIGPWEGKGRRPDPPEFGQIRLNMLTPSGVHFGQGSYAALSGDPMGAALINAGATLMQALTEKQMSAK
ncbi:MAG: hypothetical protein ACKVU0_05460 [Saprospiraceae bacterium]